MRRDQSPRGSGSRVPKPLLAAKALEPYRQFDRWMTAELAELERRWIHLATPNSMRRGRHLCR
jgi:hypothetical protein